MRRSAKVWASYGFMNAAMSGTSVAECGGRSGRDDLEGLARPRYPVRADLHLALARGPARRAPAGAPRRRSPVRAELHLVLARGPAVGLRDVELVHRGTGRCDRQRVLLH